MAVVLLSACGNAHGMGWADLWSRPEQQTLAQREQAYIEIQGQQYAAAAQRLQNFSDPISQYNRGNALAHTGDLQGAISAYDAVLHGGTTDANLKRDAQHNRDLVEQQEKSHPKSSKPGDKDGKDPKDGKDKDAKDGNDGKGTKDDKASNADNGPKEKDRGIPRNEQGRGNKQQSETDQDKPIQDQKNQSAGDANALSAKPAQPAEPKQRSHQEQELPDRPEGNPANARPADIPPPPPSEQAQSLDQWLRWIPDDPGGLLRRKFMIEHMLNQREWQQ